MSCGGVWDVSGIRNAPLIRNAESHARRRRPFSCAFPYYGLKDVGGINGELSMRKRRLLCPCAVSLDLPLLPFNMNEVFVPSETKTLHLYEARYLALLEEIERLDVGALVCIRGISRVKILKFLQADPYLKGEVQPKQDMVLDSTTNINSKVLQVKEALHSLNKLEIKLKAPKEAPLQTSCLNSLMWAENELSLECEKEFVPTSAELVSFAAFQPVSGSTQSELLKLGEEKIKAMNLKDTMQRLDNSLQLIKENISMVAAKLAIQSLEMQ